MKNLKKNYLTYKLNYVKKIYNGGSENDEYIEKIKKNYEEDNNNDNNDNNTLKYIIELFNKLNNDFEFNEDEKKIIINDDNITKNLIKEIKFYIESKYKDLIIISNIKIILKLVANEFDYNYNFSENLERNIFQLFIEPNINKLLLDSEENKKYFNIESINYRNFINKHLIKNIKKIFIENNDLLFNELYEIITTYIFTESYKFKQEQIIEEVKKNQKLFL